MSMKNLCLLISALYVFTIGYEIGFKRGHDSGRGFVGCDGKNFSIRNIDFMYLKSDTFHIGADPCVDGSGGAVTVDTNPPEKKP